MVNSAMHQMEEEIKRMLESKKPERSQRLGTAVGKWVGGVVMAGMTWVLVTFAVAFYGAALLSGGALAQAWSTSFLEWLR